MFSEGSRKDWKPSEKAKKAALARDTPAMT